MVSPIDLHLFELAFLRFMSPLSLGIFVKAFFDMCSGKMPKVAPAFGKFHVRVDLQNCKM
jgi:hypothetical protein